MRFFSVLATVAPLALSLFASASPVAQAEVVERREVTDIATRGGGVDIYSCVAVCIEAITPACNELKGLVAADITVDVLVGIVPGITGPCKDLLASLKLLIGADISVILGAYTVAEVAAQIIVWLKLIFLSFQACISICLSVNLSAVIGIFYACGLVVYAVLQVCLELCVDLKVQIALGCVSLVSIWLTLGLNVIITLLGLVVL